MLLCRGPRWAQGALRQRPSLRAGLLVRRSSLDAELDYYGGGPQDHHAVPASLIEDLRSAQSSTYTVTFILRMASLYGDHRCVQTSPGAALAVMWRRPGVLRKNWVRFATAVRSGKNRGSQLTLLLVSLS